MKLALKKLDKFRGCLIGGAAGDALGYPVEFMSEQKILNKYGDQGITAYELTDGKALISDDTQMTLFTANGLLLGAGGGRKQGHLDSYPGYIRSCYGDWLRTQTEPYPLPEGQCRSWLVQLPELFKARAPGLTCLSALRQEEEGTIDRPINDSKGCGGVMRVAPIGLYFDEAGYTPDDIDRIGAQAAALTHGHELGYIPAAALVHIIHLLSHGEDVTVLEAVLDMQRAMRRLFAQAGHLRDFLDLSDRAIELSVSDKADARAINILGEGWVAEEALAIALYCALKYSDDVDRCLIAAVNHRGDSDSTGALAGNIVGAYAGLSAIPKKYLDHLELREVILEMADDLYHDGWGPEHSPTRAQAWADKYSRPSRAPR